MSCGEPGVDGFHSTPSRVGAALVTCQTIAVTAAPTLTGVRGGHNTGPGLPAHGAASLWFLGLAVLTLRLESQLQQTDLPTPTF